MAEFCIRLPDGSTEKVEGHRIKVPGYKKIDLFIHRPLDEEEKHVAGKFWIISEVKTGGLVCKPKTIFEEGQTKQKAIRLCSGNLKDMRITESSFEKKIKETLKLYGKCKI